MYKCLCVYVYKCLCLQMSVCLWVCHIQSSDRPDIIVLNHLHSNTYVLRLSLLPLPLQLSAILPYRHPQQREFHNMGRRGWGKQEFTETRNVIAGNLPFRNDQAAFTYAHTYKLTGKNPTKCNDTAKLRLLPD